MRPLASSVIGGIAVLAVAVGGVRAGEPAPAGALEAGLQEPAAGEAREVELQEPAVEEAREGAAGTGEPAATGQAPAVIVAEVDDVISPITAEFIIGALDRAHAADAALFVLRLSTPGGLDTSMRDIMQAFLGSEVPVCIWVGPSGARAASAGFMIALAADVVAMAPGTNMGAATPVQVSGGEMDESLARKVVQDAVAYARSVAEQQGRPADLAAAAVEEGRSFPAAEALEVGLADFMAESIEDVISAAGGREVRTAAGRRTIAVAGAVTETVQMTLRERILSIIANPQIAYMLLLAGVVGLYFELSNPGVVLPGVVGAISLVLALLAFQQLPISYAGLALMVLGVVFLILEVNIVSYGLLSLAGLLAFVLGSLMLFRGPVPEMRLQLPFVLPTALAFLAIMGGLVYLVLGAHRERVTTGDAGLVGEQGRATTAIEAGGEGKVFVHGELWRARAEVPVGADESVEVVGVDPGLVVVVRPRTEQRS